MTVDTDSANTSKAHVCGFVAIAGLPNAGKSTLLNRYMKEKVSIVSNKPQTTRVNVTSILTTNDYQIIFVDTPGILKPRYKMQEVMASFITRAVEESDVILVIADVSAFKGPFHSEFEEFAAKIDASRAVVALNKIDLVKKASLLEIIHETSQLFPGCEIVPVSAIDGDGTEELLSVILAKLPQSPALYPGDVISDAPERFFVSELIREAIFLTMKQEIPYSSAVIIDSFEEKKPKVVIHASILVEKKSQKPIIIGKNGSTIKDIGSKARHGIESFLGKDVFLDLRVKIREDWRNKDAFLREIGLIKK
ncbi:GTPase Era [bacterium]|nr:GTPase Era [bacterium]